MVDAIRSAVPRQIALVLVALSTIAFWPPALDRWVLAKVMVLGIAALLALASAPTGRLPGWMLILLAVAAGVLIVSAVVNGQPVAALLGRWPRYEGVVTATGYVLALLLGARLLGPGSTPRDARVLERTLAVIALALAVISLLESAGLRPLPSDLARPGALLGNATDQGAVAAAIAVVLLARVLRSGRTRTDLALLGVASALAGLTVILSGSRAALLALVLGAIAAVVWSPVARGTRIVVGAAAVAGIAALALVVPAMSTRLFGLGSPAGDGFADRLTIWRETLAVVASHPVLGAGPSGYLDAVAAVQDVDWFTSAGDNAVLDSPHDVLLQALVAGGPLLLALVLVTLAATTLSLVHLVREAGEERRSVVIPAALGAGVLAVVLLSHVSAPATVIPAAFLAGAAVARTPRPERPAIRAIVAVPIVAWLALVAVTLAGESALASGVSSARAGRIADADTAFELTTRLRPWDPDSVVISAEALTARVGAGDMSALATAQHWTSRALAAAPGSLAAGKAAVTISIAAGDLPRARSLLAGLRERYPLDPWVAHRAGAVELGLGDVAAAEDLLLLATTLDPDRADPWLTLAYLYAQRGDEVAAADAQAHADTLGR